jgi:Tol biopolymer transport system component
VAVDVKSARQTGIGDSAWTAVDSVAWTPDGGGLVIAAQEDAPGATRQIWHVAYPSGEVRRITNDLNSYANVSVSADGRTLAAVQSEALAHLWVAPIDGMDRARQITTGTGRDDGRAGLAWTADQRLIYTSNASGNRDLWIVDASGDNPRQLTTDPAPDYRPVVSPDGRSIVFWSSRENGFIWRMDIDGGNQRPLVTTRALGPLISPDSKWLYYTSFAEPQRSVWRLPYDGGAAERLTAPWDEMGIRQDGIFFHPTMYLLALMPDGKHGIGRYTDPERRGFHLALVPLDGGAPKKLFAARLLPVVATPDGQHLLHFATRNGVPSLVRQPLAGGPASVLATFADESSLNFALSRDGTQIAFSRGVATSDVVLLKQER